MAWAGGRCCASHSCLRVDPGSARVRHILYEESTRAIKTAVERCAMQCYVVEGAFPPSLAYLVENYGLQINEKEFYVSYDIFASNVPPAVKVIGRN